MLKTSIELQDNFSATIHNIIESVNLSITSMEQLHQSVSSPVDSTAFENVRNSINKATMDIQELENAFRKVKSEKIEAPSFNDVSWVSPNFEVFTNSGIDRFKQEILSTNNLLNTLNESQLNLSNTASRIDILPNNMISDIDKTRLRIEGLKNKILEIENNPLSFVDESSSDMLESLRSKLAQAVSEQEELNNAVKNFDVESANRAYLKLSNTIDGAEIHIRNNINGQDNFNRKLRDGQSEADKLMGLIKGAVGAYLTINGVKTVLNVSDTLTSTTARLNLMNDGLQTTEDLQNMIYASAERSRGSFQDTADAVSKLGLMAGDAFSSSQEIIAFTEQLNKQFTIAGTEASGVSAAMLQLTQAMGSGVLRGEEYNSILEQAPNIIASIADYMGVSKGELKALAGEGKITAEIVKNAMFSATEQTNAQFESMPKTFSQIGTSIKNTATMAFKPLQERLEKLSSSEAFKSLINGINSAIVTIAKVVVWIYDLVAPIGKFIADNWSIISPIVYGIAIALGILAGALVLYKMVTIASSIAQWALNSAILACPITWIILAVIALIAVIFSVINAIAKFTGLATSGFSLICGAVNVVIQFFFNLWKTVGNIAMGIWNAISALAHNIKTAFSNSIYNVQSSFYNLLSTALDVVGSICEALNKLPFISFDFSGITSKADEYANKAREAQSKKGEYKNIVDEFNKGFNTFDAFGEGWISDAFNSGTAWGDSIGDKFSNILNGFTSGGNLNIPDFGDIKDVLGEIENGTSDTAGNTGAIKDSLDISSDDLKYLRDIAERDVVNRFTTAEIKVDMGGITNNVNNGMDLDSIIDRLTTGVNEAMERVAEGVHV